jgi:hypothetical protein
VRDPISDWFSNEQYQVRHNMPARPGYLDGEGRPNVAATRAFLTNVLPQLQEWRPLIEAGVVILVTAEDHALAHQDDIALLQVQLEAKLLTDPVAYAEQFTPSEIAVEDNVRGFFVFAGGDQVSQLKRAQSDGIYHFAREYVLATHHGATYTAPFRHERYLCREGLTQIATPASRVVEALLRSELPIFHGLTPGIIGKIHDDDGFASFRERLHTVYAQVPFEGPDEYIRSYLHEQESALLEPALRQAEKSAKRGPIGRIGVTLTQNAFALNCNGHRPDPQGSVGRYWSCPRRRRRSRDGQRRSRHATRPACLERAGETPQISPGRTAGSEGRQYRFTQPSVGHSRCPIDGCHDL